MYITDGFTVNAKGLIQTLLVRLPLAYYMSIQSNASLTNIGFAAPVATVFGIVLNNTSSITIFMIE